MIDEVLALYQQVILDHNRTPRNFRVIEGGRRAHGDNPLCGDRLTVYVKEEGGRITDASFQGVGCAICIASASLMTGVVRGKTADEIDALGDRVRDIVSAAPGAPVDDPGGLSALSGVRRFPVRAKCALLPWRTLHAAIRDPNVVSSTE